MLREAAIWLEVTPISDFRGLPPEWLSTLNARFEEPKTFGE